MGAQRGAFYRQGHPAVSNGLQARAKMPPEGDAVFQRQMQGSEQPLLPLAGDR